MDTHKYLGALRRRWWVAVVLAVVGAAGGVAHAGGAAPTYTSSITFFLSTPAQVTNSALTSDQFAQERAVSYAQVASSQLMATRIVAVTHIDLSPRQVARRISASVGTGSVLLTVTVRDTSGARAVQISSAVGSQFQSVVGQLDPPRDTGPPILLNVVSGPSSPGAVGSPRNKDLVEGLLAGLLLGLVLVAWFSVLDPSVRTVDDLDEIPARPPVLALIRRTRRARSGALISDADQASLRAEEYRQLQTALRLTPVDGSPRVIMVTSSVRGEGRTSTATNLAISLARTESRVLLIEADLRTAGMGAYLDLPTDGAGLSDVLRGTVEAGPAIQNCGSPWLQALLAGSGTDRPSELLSGPAARVLVDRLRDQYDYIVVDAPPVLTVADAMALSPLVDAVIVVVRAGGVSLAELSAALDALRTVHAPVTGLVLNRARPGALGSGRTGPDLGYGSHLGEPVSPDRSGEFRTQPLEVFEHNR